MIEETKSNHQLGKSIIHHPMFLRIIPKLYKKKKILIL